MTITPGLIRDAIGELRALGFEAKRCAMLADAIEIADSSSAALIECSAPLHDDRGHAWRDLASVESIDREGIDQAVRYLTARELLERHPEQGQWVRVREPAEA